MCHHSTPFSKGTCRFAQKKLNDLQQAIDTSCTCYVTETVPNTWTSLPLTYIGGTDMQYPGTLAYVIPSVIPSTAKNVLIYVILYTSSANSKYQSIKIFTQDGSNKRYEKYLFSYSYPQNAINTNSGNMWFPMPANRRIYMIVTDDAGLHCGANLFAIGYNWHPPCVLR